MRDTPLVHSVWSVFVPLVLFALAVGWPVGQLAVLVHEVGHAAAARLVGEQVLGMELGRPPVLRRWTVADVPITLGWVPAGGATHHTVPLGRAAALRTVVIAAAGPVANLAVAACLFGAAALTPRPLAVGIVLAGLGAIQGFGALSLVPVPGKPPRRHATDGWLILSNALHLPSARESRVVADLLVQRRALEDESPDVDGRVAMARSALAACRPTSPGATVAAALLAADLVERGRPSDAAEVEQVARVPINDPTVSDEDRGAFANRLAWQLATGPTSHHPEWIPVALLLARCAQHLMPSAAVEDTIALVLVRAGKHRTALRHAARAAASCAGCSSSELASVAAVRAMAAAGAGDLDLALEQQRLARELDAACLLLDEVADAIAGASSAPTSPPPAHGAATHR